MMIEQLGCPDTMDPGTAEAVLGATEPDPEPCLHGTGSMGGTKPNPQETSTGIDHMVAWLANQPDIIKALDGMEPPVPDRLELDGFPTAASQGPTGELRLAPDSLASCDPAMPPG